MASGRLLLRWRHRPDADSVLHRAMAEPAKRLGLRAGRDELRRADLQGNANLGAKFLKWLSCFYSYWGNNGGTSVSNPGAYTAAWYYKNAGLPFPDSASATSLCKAVYDDPQQPWYPALPSANTTTWSCPSARRRATRRCWTSR